MSEQSLDQLIASIKTDAIDAAEKASKEILEAARNEAAQIEAQANDQKAVILQEARQEADTIVNNGKKMLQQAARDLSISLSNDLITQFKEVLEIEVRKGFSPDLIQDAIMKVMDSVGSNVAIELPKELKMELNDFIRDKVQNSNDPINFRLNESLKEGFKVVKKDEGWSYEITPETTREALQKHFTGNWIDILKKED